MAKIYFPTYDDVKINNGKELQLKSSAGSKLLSECELGEIVYLPETINDTKDFHEYIVVEKNDNNVVLLRKYVDTTGYGYQTTNYFGDFSDTWCLTTFSDRFSNGVKDYFTNKNIYNGNDYNKKYADRNVFIPLSNEFTTWFTSNDSRKAYTLENIGTAVTYWTRTSSGNLGTNRNVQYRIETGGFVSSSGYEGNKNSFYYRPAVVFLPSTPLNGSNQFIDEITYTDSIDTIKFGDDLYRVKDVDARNLIETKQSKLPNGTNAGDIVYWDGTGFVVGDISNVITDADNIAY